MGKGYGFGAEGDWKTAALGAVIKKMGGNGSKGSSFIEACTYDYAQDDVYTLGAHMLDVDPSIAAITPAIEVHPLGIGGKEAPARLVFEGKEGSATFSSLIDLGGRFRLIVQDIDCVKPTKAMPNLPVARVMWKSVGPFANALECLIRSAGSHHTVLSYDADAESLGDSARIMGIEFVHLNGQTTPEALEHDLFLSDLAWRLRP
jgi:L-arabinose isomerase